MSQNGQVRWKIPPQWIASDDCVVHVGRRIERGEIVDEGTPYNIHTGEGIKVVPVSSIRAMFGLDFGDAGDELKGEALTKRLRAITASFEAICETLAKRVTWWDWTDLTGEPYSQPYGCPEVLKDLHVDEIMYLVGALAREGTAEKKDGGSPSPDTSSTASPALAN